VEGKTFGTTMGFRRNVGKTMEKPWKNMKKPWKNHGKTKTMENPWKKNMEKPWKTIVSMKLVLFEMTLFYKVVPHGEMCVDLVSLQVTI
jgi:hypothetical protein